ncbi:MAG: hypothetical protein NTZ80_04260 [Patescibacteria group bacterium]|nr:hypothetical protein [Patescibacteria group bacterium]
MQNADRINRKAGGIRQKPEEKLIEFAGRVHDYADEHKEDFVAACGKVEMNIRVNKNLSAGKIADEFKYLIAAESNREHRVEIEKLFSELNAIDSDDYGKLFNWFIRYHEKSDRQDHVKDAERIQSEMQEKGWPKKIKEDMSQGQISAIQQINDLLGEDGMGVFIDYIKQDHPSPPCNMITDISIKDFRTWLEIYKEDTDKNWLAHKETDEIKQVETLKKTIRGEPPTD